MSDSFKFDELVELCRRTHEQAQMLVARLADTSMVVRTVSRSLYC